MSTTPDDATTWRDLADALTRQLATLLVQAADEFDRLER
ncbi:hypothetical protein MYIN104542_13845 [Mycobacterium intermedium]